MPPKKDKDPNKPKGRTSAYAFFVQDRRGQYKEEGKSINFADFSRESADLWKRMKDGDKTKYQKLSDEDKERYQREMAEYKPPSDDEEGGGQRRRRRKKKDPNMPKRCMSGFMFFSSDKRPKLREQTPSASVGDIAKQLGAAWKIMTADQKAPYEKQAKKDRERYERDMELYRKGEFSHNPPSEDEEEDDDED